MPENLPHRTPSAAPMQATEWGGELADRLREAFAALPDDGFKFLTYLGQNFIELSSVPECFVLLTYLKTNEQFDVLTDLTAVDHPSEERRFEVIYILYSFPRNEYLRVKVRVDIAPLPPHDFQVPSITSLFPAANWLEREVFDMFGIDFPGHPNLKRILMPEDWEGFPLRKDKSIVTMDQDWVERNLGIESGQ